MTDRYEQFKQYCVENHIIIHKIESHSKDYYGDNGLLNELFKGFEAKMEREEREKEIKDIIKAHTRKVNHIFSEESMLVVEADMIYKELKDGGYLK